MLGRNIFLSLVRHWHGMPSEVVETPGMQGWLNGALGSLIYWVVLLPMAGGSELYGLYITSNPRHSMIL